MEDKSKAAAAAAGLAGPELTPAHRGLGRLILFKNKCGSNLIKLD